MSLGPVEYVVIGFPGTRLNDDIVPALADLVASATVRIIDLMVVTKDADGTVAMLEYEDLGDAPGFADLEGDVSNLFSEEDASALAVSMLPDSTALVILWEDLWAAPLAEAVRRAEGSIVSGARIPPDVMADAFAAAQ